MKFPFYHQLDAMDCGPTCLRMVAKHYGNMTISTTSLNLCKVCFGYFAFQS